MSFSFDRAGYVACHIFSATPGVTWWMPGFFWKDENHRKLTFCSRKEYDGLGEEEISPVFGLIFTHTGHRGSARLRGSFFRSFIRALPLAARFREEA
jgi:hypothetical protein